MNVTHGTTAPVDPAIRKFGQEFNAFEGPLASLAELVKSVDWLVCQALDVNANEYGQRKIADGCLTSMYRLMTEAVKVAKECDQRFEALGAMLDEVEEAR